VDITSGVGFRPFGPGYQALGANCKSEFFDCFYWKLG